MPTVHVSRLTSRKGIQVDEPIKWIILLAIALILVITLFTILTNVGTEGVPFVNTLIAGLKNSFGMVPFPE